MPFLTNDPLPQCLQPSPLTPLLLAQGHQRGSKRHLSNVKCLPKTTLPTSRDQARQVATGDDYISIKETLAIFIAEGRPVTERTLQRYCDKNQLTGQKVMTGEGEKWFALKSSVFNRLAELQEFDRLRASR